MILLDTHVFVWWAAHRGKVSARGRRAIEKDRQPAISAITLWEVAKLVSLERLNLDRDVELWLEQALEETGIETIAIEPAIAVRSTRIAPSFHGDPADQLIAATAIERALALVTMDERLRASPAVKTIW